MPRDAVSRTAHDGTVGKNGLNATEEFEGAGNLASLMPRDMNLFDSRRRQIPSGLRIYSMLYINN